MIYKRSYRLNLSGIVNYTANRGHNISINNGGEDCENRAKATSQVETRDIFRLEKARLQNRFF